MEEIDLAGMLNRELSENDPLVSVVLPTYKDVEYIERSINSVYNQTYGNIELVIVDSNDNSPLVGVGNSSNWISRVEQEPSGVAAARNRGIRESSGDVITFIDADDEWLHNKLEVQVGELGENIHFVYSDEYRVWDGQKFRFHSLENTSEEPLWINHFLKGKVPLRTVACNAECFEHHRFDENLEMSEDPHLWTRILRSYNAKKINQPLAVKYNRADSLTSDYKSLYENQLRSAVDLANRFQELRVFLIQRLLRIKYAFAVNAWEHNDIVEARSSLRCLISHGHRLRMTIPLFVLTYIPIARREIYNLMKVVRKKLS